MQTRIEEMIREVSDMIDDTQDYINNSVWKEGYGSESHYNEQLDYLHDLMESLDSALYFASLLEV